MDVFASQHGFHKSQIDQHNQSRLVNITNSRLINTTNPQIDFLSATWAKPRLVMGLIFFNHQSGLVFIRLDQSRLVFFNLGSSGSTPNVIRATDELREMASHH